MYIEEIGINVRTLINSSHVSNTLAQQEPLFLCSLPVLLLATRFTSRRRQSFSISLWKALVHCRLNWHSDGKHEPHAHHSGRSHSAWAVKQEYETSCKQMKGCQNHRTHDVVPWYIETEYRSVIQMYEYVQEKNARTAKLKRKWRCLKSELIPDKWNGRSLRSVIGEQQLVECEGNQRLNMKTRLFALSGRHKYRRDAEGHNHIEWHY